MPLKTTKVKLVARKLTSGQWLINAEYGTGEAINIQKPTFSEAFDELARYIGADEDRSEWPTDVDTPKRETSIERG